MTKEFLEVIGNAAKFTLHYDDDFFDRLSHRYTLIILFISTFICGTKQYVGDPIDCWAPAHFTGEHEKYTENICWISNTFYVPSDENIPYDIPTRHERELSYYQWVPFILLSMAILFYLPHIVWRVFNSKAGIDISGVVKTMDTIKHLDPDEREKTTKYLVRHMDKYLKLQLEYGVGSCSRARQWLANKLCFICGKKFGNQMIFMYIFVKCLYITNAVAQLFLLNGFLRTDYNFYGMEILGKVINGSDWKESRRFPRVTLCDFEIRNMGGTQNLHRYTVQCVLPVNLFSEKIFIFIWFWLVMVAALSIWGLLPWILTLFYRTRMHYVKKYLTIANGLNTSGNNKLARVFTEKYLRQDGVFILRLVSKNTNDIVIADLVIALWEHFRKFRKEFHSTNEA